MGIIKEILTEYKQKKLASNIVFLALTQIVNVLFPLILVPYLVRVLGSESWGKFSFVQAIIAYFVLIVDYGFNISATQRVAVTAKDIPSLRNVFYNVINAKILLTVISLLTLTIITFTVPKFAQEWRMYLLMTMMIVGYTLYPQWFFQGVEKMGYITIVNVAIKTIYLILTLCLIKTPDDYTLAAGLMGVSFLIPGIVSFIIARNMVGGHHTFSMPGTLFMLKDGFPVFLSSAMSSVLYSSAIVFVGFITTDAITGGYAAMDKLIKAIILVFYPITTAIYPKVSKALSENEKDGINLIVKLSIPVLLLTLLLMAFFYFTEDYIVTLLFTSEFIQYTPIFNWLLIWMFFSVLNNFIGVQYMTASNRKSQYATAFLIAGVGTIILFPILIKKFSAAGASIAILCGEVSLTLIMLLMILLSRRSQHE